MKLISSLYIHFPFCRHLCNYCDFYKHKLDDASQIKEFEGLLSEQFDWHENYLEQKSFALGELESLYLGGGTPSLWGDAGIQFMQSLLKTGKIKLATDCEFTLEVDPDAWSEQEIDGWIHLGVNRFSIGSQAFSDKFIKTMDRTHKLADVEKTIKYFSERNLNHSVDLMLGLPYSEERKLEEELRNLLSYHPNHISVYILKTRKNYSLSEKLPDDDLVRNEYLVTSKLLTEAGYDHYEVSNFARDGFYSKHNLKYWAYESVAGIGPNATGLLVEDDKAIRYQWKSVSMGVQEEVVEGEALIIEKLFLGLRSKSHFNLLSLLPGNESIFNRLCEQWKKQGYLAPEATIENLKLSPLGYLMCDSLIDDVFKQVKF